MTTKQNRVAYFCMEYGLDPKLPLYAGGLGILAGDYLKAARELDCPVVGIGILWWQDYTQQYINDQGYPYDIFETHNFAELVDTGKTIQINVAGRDVQVKIHKVSGFDNAPLYLLDTGKPGSEFGWVNDKLYSGTEYDRIVQEILLGIGGVRALRALGIKVDTYHFNEGHACFAGLELIKEKMNQDKLSFEEALNFVRQEIVFTTHTPVPAGNESHNIELLMETGASNGFSFDQLKSLGGQPFNMTAGCLHLSRIANGVSELHGETARRMWRHLSKAAKIIAITNGVNQNSWQDPAIKQAFQDNGNLWDTHLKAKQRLVDYVHEKTGARMNKDNLIIGFARRAAPYKRSELIFRDTSKIDDLLQEGKLQLVFSGKAHPDDRYGKEIVARLVKMDKKYEDNVVFLENYNMETCRHMIQGCDVWLNNPRRPMEASGTSGMKAALNGILNLSVLDGWVAEGPEHGVNAWILDEVFSSFDHKLNEDEKDLRALYHLLREEVIPIYYEDKERWVEMMRSSIEMAEEQFTAQRMIEDYYREMYQAQEGAKQKSQQTESAFF